LADISKFLRVEQGNRQISEQKDRKQKGQCSDQVHGLPQFLTCHSIEEGDGEKQRSEEQHGQILHKKLRIQRRGE
jgi:hypothetical protein